MQELGNGGPRRGSPMSAIILATDPLDADHFHEECGVFGVFGHPDAAAVTALGLHALQHRGQEAAGIVAYDGEQFNAHRGPGLVGDNFSSKDVIDRLPGSVAIGHVRYATTGEVAQRNIQPTFAAFELRALDIIGADFVRDVAPGEIVIIGAGGVKSVMPFADLPHRLCVFEYISFARPDSVVEGHSVYEARKRIGRELAREAPVDADVVVPVPDSGVPAALGYAAESGLPFELGIIRNHYVGRTFIEPTDQIRHLGVRLKPNANRADLKGKRIVLVDDSIVRGTTSTKIVEMIRNAGAREVHMRVSSPPTRFPCFYGIATPSRAPLLAARSRL